MNGSFKKNIPDEDEMLKFGASLASLCGDTAVIFLHGDLGVGKTTLTRGFLQGLGYKSKVKSPTYTIVEPYEIDGKKVYHFDLYRLDDPQELEFIGVQDYFVPHAICLVEWPELGTGLLPVADLSCYIEANLTTRHLRVEANTAQGRHILIQLIQREAQ